MTAALAPTSRVTDLDPRHAFLPGQGEPASGGSVVEGRVSLVCVDGSDASVQALVWAFGNAVETNMSVEVLTTWPQRGAVFVHDVPGHFCAPRWEARAIQNDVVARALFQADRVPPYSMRLENSEIGDALFRASMRCDLLVMGQTEERSYASGAPRRRLTELVTARASCRVAVVSVSGLLTVSNRARRPR